MSQIASEVRALAEHIIEHEVMGRQTPAEVAQALEDVFRCIHKLMSSLVGPVVKVLMEADEMTAEQLASAMQMGPVELSQALGRLVDLKYAIESVEDGRAVYRPVERPLASR